MRARATFRPVCRHAGLRQQHLGHLQIKNNPEEKLFIQAAVCPTLYPNPENIHQKDLKLTGLSSERTLYRGKILLSDDKSKAGFKRSTGQNGLVINTYQRVMVPLRRILRLIQSPGIAAQFQITCVFPYAAGTTAQALNI